MFASILNAAENIKDDLPEKFGQLIGHHLRANGVAAGNIRPEILEATMRRLLQTDREQRSRNN